MDSPSRSSSTILFATPGFSCSFGCSGLRSWLISAALVALLLASGQATVDSAQIPGVTNGGIYAGVPQPGGPSTPTTPAVRRSEVFDPVALARAKSFCVDLRNLESRQAADVKEFLTLARQAGTVLDRLPWRLTDDCTKADAVARIYFVPVGIREERAGGSFAASQVSSRQDSQPVLLLYDKACIRLFYRAEGQVFRGNAGKVLASPFALLIKDLEKINGHT